MFWVFQGVEKAYGLGGLWGSGRFRGLGEFRVLRILTSIGTFSPQQMLRGEFSRFSICALAKSHSVISAAVAQFASDMILPAA